MFSEASALQARDNPRKLSQEAKALGDAARAKVDFAASSVVSPGPIICARALSFAATHSNLE